MITASFLEEQVPATAAWVTHPVRYTRIAPRGIWTRLSPGGKTWESAAGAAEEGDIFAAPERILPLTADERRERHIARTAARMAAAAERAKFAAERIRREVAAARDNAKKCATLGAPSGQEDTREARLAERRAAYRAVHGAPKAPLTPEERAANIRASKARYRAKHKEELAAKQRERKARLKAQGA